MPVLRNAIAKKTMETPVKYEVDKPIYPGRVFGKKLLTEKPTVDNKRQEVLRSPYFQCVSLNAASMLAVGGIPPEEYERLIDSAIAFTDMLIEKVAEKMSKHDELIDGHTKETILDEVMNSGNRFPDCLPENYENVDERLKSPELKSVYQARDFFAFLRTRNYSIPEITSGQALKDYEQLKANNVN
ncbi:MAG: hypothetical protein ACRC1Z_26665 [Waterburya sp.]